MNPNAPFERDLERWLQAQAPTRAPAGLHTAVIDRARTMRQRPGWTFLGRWFGRGRGRGVILFAAGALLLVGGAMAAGSGLVRLPSDVPPEPAPTLAAVVTNPTAEPTPGPTVAPLPAPTASPTVPGRAPSWSAAGSMNWDGRVATRLLDGRLLAIGGSTNGYESGCLCAAQLYDPATGSWTATGNVLGGPFDWVATLLQSGQVLVAGDTGRAQLYDPATGSWTATGSMRVQRHGATAALLPDGTVLVAGGYSVRSNDSHEQLTSAELYDPATGSWTTTGDMLHAGMGAATLLANGKVLVLAGVNGTIFSGDVGTPVDELGAAELYDPATGTWSATGSMSANRVGFATALLANGKVLVVGGTVGDIWAPPIASAELYDPATGMWTATGSMLLARKALTATLLLDGRVLVAGGWESRGNSLWGPPSSAELYEPSTGTWTATTSVITPRAGGSATLLLDGRVLVAGGDGGDGPDGGSLASAELYDPGSGR